VAQEEMKVFETCWTTEDEIGFLMKLAYGEVTQTASGIRRSGANLTAFRRYAEIVVSGSRTYDKNIRVDRVIDAAMRFTAALDKAVRTEEVTQ
jgi:hypothetical protein